MAIYYLDIDDEITSAAARIRDSSDSRIALVLSGGSRVATSRINFRLLAREARQRNKRLAIITADASVQSVARSAELPVYATVNEYERSEAAAARGAQGMPPVETSVALDELALTVAPGGAAGRPAGPGAPRYAGRPPAMTSAPGRSRVPWPLVAGALLLVLVVLAATAFFFYPSATVVVTLRQETLGPMTVSVNIDPGIAAANDQALKVPGLSKDFPVEVSDTFDATGQNVVDTAASGTVTFTSINTVFAVPIIAGTQVSTTSGVAFVTTKTVTVAKAPFATRMSVDAPVQAVQKGTAGNVPAGRIVKLPADLVAAQVTVTNANPTTGGAHNVTPMVVQADIDRAKTTLLAALEARLQDALQAPAAVPSGSSLFAESAHLGVAICNPDPQGFLNQDAATFQLDCQATGTATMADMTGVVALAERRARAAVRTGYALVEGSVTTQVGATITQGSALVVPVTVQAVQVPAVDVGQLKAAVLGKSLDEARSYLAQYGQVEISVSPDWSSTMPSFDFRIDLQVIVPTVEPSASPSQAGEPRTTKRPTIVPRTPVLVSPGVSPGVSPSPSLSASLSPSPTDTPTPAPSPSPSDAPSDVPSASPSPS